MTAYKESEGFPHNFESLYAGEIKNPNNSPLCVRLFAIAVVTWQDGHKMDSKTKRVDVLLRKRKARN